MSKKVDFDLRLKMSYKPLWKMLVDKNMRKQDLRQAAKISATTMARLNSGDNVTTDVLLRICQVLECQIEEVCEVIE